MQDSSKRTVVEFLQTKSFKTLLDVPSGKGWLQKSCLQYLGLLTDLSRINKTLNIKNQVCFF